MKRLLLGAFIASSILAFSGCSIKTASASKPVCVGCDGMPECVPGPLGDCLPSKK